MVVATAPQVSDLEDPLTLLMVLEPISGCLQARTRVRSNGHWRVQMGSLSSGTGYKIKAFVPKRKQSVTAYNVAGLLLPRSSNCSLSPLSAFLDLRKRRAIARFRA